MEDQKTEKILIDLSEPAIVRAIEANLFELIKARRIWPRAEVRDEPEMLSCFTDVPYPHFNVILRAQMLQERIEYAILSLIEYCRLHKVAMGWLIGPAYSATTLSDSLVAHGFAHMGDNPGMSVDLQKMNDRIQAPAGLIIKRIDADDIRTWCQVVFAKSGGMPDFVTEAFVDMYTNLGPGTNASTISYYLGLVNGEPVGASMLVLGAGVAGIYNVATIPEAQRKGIGSAMTLAPLREARTLGYRVGVLHSSDMGFNVYLRLGFQEYYNLGVYVWSPEHKQGAD